VSSGVPGRSCCWGRLGQRTASESCRQEVLGGWGTTMVDSVLGGWARGSSMARGGARVHGSGGTGSWAHRRPEQGNNVRGGQTEQRRCWLHEQEKDLDFVSSRSTVQWIRSALKPWVHMWMVGVVPRSGKRWAATACLWQCSRKAPGARGEGIWSWARSVAV
jgi:hypothetical protein